MVEDDTGSVYEPYQQLAQQVPAFLADLENRGWDYHFATLLLTDNRPITQIMTSKYDPNWGSLWEQPYPWIPPFPGAFPRIPTAANQAADIPGTVIQGYFSTPESYGGFLTPGDLNNGLNGNEPGLKNISDILAGSSMTVTGFLRPDAILAILVVGNGNDTSDVTLCNRGRRGLPSVRSAPAASRAAASAEPAPTRLASRTARKRLAGRREASSFTNFYNRIRQRKAVSSQLKFFSAVAQGSYSSCLGGSASPVLATPR